MQLLAWLCVDTFSPNNKIKVQVRTGLLIALLYHCAYNFLHFKSFTQEGHLHTEQDYVNNLVTRFTVVWILVIHSPVKMFLSSRQAGYSNR